MNAVIYARYSSDKQTEQSIEGQVRYCLDYAKQHDLTVVNQYIDRGLSGTNDRRPAFQQMIRDSGKRLFKVVLLYKFDRFARNMYDSAIYEHKLEQNGVKVVSVTEPIGEGNESIILKAMLRATAEIYSRQLSDNVKRGMRESALKAHSTGGYIPLGYKVEDKKLAIDNKHAWGVKYIFERYYEGDTKTQIVNALKEKGFLRPDGKPVTVQNLTYILSNVKYTGVFVYEDVRIDGGCPAIISSDLFDACQERVERAKKHFGRRPPEDVDYLLFGKLFCGYCGKPMSGDSGTSRSGQKHHYYTCYTRKSKKRTGKTCRKKSEKKGFLEWYVVKQTLDFVLTDDRIDYIAAKVVEAYDQASDPGKVKECKKRLSEIDREVTRLVDALVKTDNQTAIDKINNDLTLLETQKADIEGELVGLQIARQNAITQDEVKKWLKSFCVGDALDTEFQKKIIDTFVNSIYLYDDKIVLFWNVKDSKQVSYIDMLKYADQLDDSGGTECSSSLLSGEPRETLSEHIKYIFLPDVFGCVIPRD